MNKLKKFSLSVCGFMISILILTVTNRGSVVAQQVKDAAIDWSFNATIIEACSCPMFCQCNFNSAKPAAHGGHPSPGAAVGYFCRFNRAFKVKRGKFGATKMDDVKFWMSWALRGEFSNDQMDWAVPTFDPWVTKDQRDATVAILRYLYPVKWNSFTVATDALMEWRATRDRAEARLGGGKTAQLLLNKAEGMTDEPIII